jgi:hypothetical protein
MHQRRADVMAKYVRINGRYRPYDEGNEYLYIGRYTADIPSHWEAKVRRSDDRFQNVLTEFRVELSGPLVDLDINHRALAHLFIEHAIQEWVSTGKATSWINWYALMRAEKTEVLD